MSAIDVEAKQRVTFFTRNVASKTGRCDPYAAGPQDRIVGLVLGNELRTGEIRAWKLAELAQASFEKEAWPVPAVSAKRGFPLRRPSPEGVWALTAGVA